MAAGKRPVSDEHYQLARWFERQLSSSGQFQYTLQGPERDTSIDAIEDFVSNNRRGYCEYFATALALMLRSVGIPSRVVLGYRCDEWHEDEQCYQVRQLHAHAWVEAFLDRIRSPRNCGGASRSIGRMAAGCLDPTPAADLGTQAAERTTWGAWQGRLHALQHYWDKYIVNMDRNKQRESVYEPISRAMQKLRSRLFDFHWWRELAAGLWASLAATLGGGVLGWLFGAVVLMAIAIVPLAAGWWLVRRLRRLWRRFAGSGGRGRAGSQDLEWAVEFYRRFEQIVGRFGLQRAAGQTPCVRPRCRGPGWPRSAVRASSTRGPCRSSRPFIASASDARCWTRNFADHRAGLGRSDGGRTAPA